MSFSSEVKQELAKQSGKSRHCQIAELAALVAFDGKRQQLIGDAGDVLDSENPLLQEKYGLLLAQLFHVNIEEIDTLPPERILETIKMWNQSLRCADITETVNGILLQQTCCRRAYGSKDRRTKETPGRIFKGRCPDRGYVKYHGSTCGTDES